MYKYHVARIGKCVSIVDINSILMTVTMGPHNDYYLFSCLSFSLVHHLLKEKRCKFIVLDLDKVQYVIIKTWASYVSLGLRQSLAHDICLGIIY